MSFDLTALLSFANDQGASDLHISARPAAAAAHPRRDGASRDAAAQPPRTPSAAIYDLMKDDQKRVFEEHHDLDFAFEIPGLSRFRANVMMQQPRRGQAVFRLVPTEVRTLEELGMPAGAQGARREASADWWW